jgi:hypothetical protein
MLRLLFLVIAVIAVIALVTRRPGPRRLLVAMLILAALYAVLKLTGVFEAIAPDRLG